MTAHEEQELDVAQPQQQQQQQQQQRRQQPQQQTLARHLASMSEHNRLSWGGGSAPSLPSIDDDPNSDAVSITDSVKSSTMSIDSSLYHFVEENGRTYHKYKQGRYFLPNDLAEQERLGTGIWAIEFASQYPESEVVGTDLSPIQPQYLPENCRFEIDDAEDEWTFSEPFSFIHGRALMSCFDDPARVVRQAYENLEPGGAIEFQDALFPMYWVGEPPTESALYRWNELLMEGLRRIGRSWSNVVHYYSYFEEAGFENIVERRFYWPTSPWAKGKYFKTVAMYFQEDMISGLEAISMKVLQATGMTSDEILAFCEEVKADFRDTNLHAYLKVSYIYARKPLPKSA
ncbi:putative methyltransferase domain-containing protein [Rosellinia necatrix]|uniref:Putative methyltransferase domain-containing protein n=1 Tax=Rosellinia necatrix TaxID=77044 RepID=A0A1S7UL13_ROSNE|nr:putative methyltransferase domain-containing protein [Rosellinia necatrix]